ncbi:MAG: glycosyltransferase family 9 protein, partial [Steroidobacteraceae bacterium]
PVDILGSGAWTRPLLTGQPGVGEIYLLRGRSRPFWLGPDQWRLLRDLKRRGAGPTWLFDAHIDKARRLLARAGWPAGEMVTLDRLPDVYGEPFCDRWRRFVQLDPPSGPPLSSAAAQPALRASAQVATAGEGLCGDRTGSVPQLQISAQSREDLDAWLRRLGLAGRAFILVQVGNKRTMRRGDRQRSSNTKYWPEERWAAVLRGLHASHPQHALLLLGVPQEEALNAQILALAGVGDAHSVAREMTVPRLMALSERAAGMISVDTGPAHVAAAVGCAALVLYTCPSTRQIYAARARGAPVRYLMGGTDERPSLMGITAEQVVEGWRGMMGG